MKRIIIFCICSLIATVATAQGNKYIHVNRNDGGFNQILRSDVDSIKWSLYDYKEGFTDKWKSQLIYTEDRLFIVPLSVTESIQFSMPYKDVDKIYYDIQPMEEETGWDSLMVASNGACALFQKTEDGVVRIVADSVYARNHSTATIYSFTEGMIPISIITERGSYYFRNYSEGKADLTFSLNGVVRTIRNVDVSNIDAVSTRSGVSQNHIFEKLNFAYGMGNLVSGAVKAELGSFADVFFTGLSESKEWTPEGNFIMSLIGLPVGFVFGPISVPVIVGGFVLAHLQYFEDIENQRKREMYARCVGESRIETLKPQKIDEDTYRIGVKVDGTATIPRQYVNQPNEFGILLKKLPLSQPTFTLNIYDKDAVFYQSAHLEKDGEYYTEIAVELGYKYAYCGYIVTCEEEDYRQHGGPASVIDAYNSFAYYGNKEELIMGYSMIEDCRQVSADYADGVIIFEADVDVVFSPNEIMDASEYGVTVCKNGVPVNDFPLKGGINKGAVKIRLEADKKNLTIDKQAFTASTIEFWTVVPYKKNKWGAFIEYHESGVPLDLVYDKSPVANTLPPIYKGTTTAMLEFEFNDFMFWDGTIAYQYWEEGESPVEKIFDIQWNGKQKTRLTNLKKETLYHYKAIIRHGDMIIAEGAIESFNTWGQLVKLTDFVQTGATYMENAFENENVWYSYKYDVAVTFELVDETGVKDWGYKYIDLQGKIKDISLKGKKSPFTDTNYSYYRNEPESWVTFQPYVKFEDETALSETTTRAIGLENNEENGVWYGNPVTYKLRYSTKLPVCSTGKAVNITSNSATLTGTIKNYDPTDETAQYIFFYSTDYDVMNSSYKKSVPAQYDGNGKLMATVNNLTDFTNYYFTLAFKKENSDYEVGITEEFKTYPVVATDKVNNTTFGTAFLRGTCSKGFYGVEFAVKKETDTEFEIYRAQTNGDGVFTASIEYLVPNTKYDYYACIQTEDGVLKGEVCTFTTKPFLICPDDHHPHIIDLGLPSGTKWACCNIGASKPEDFGGLYAWGQTKENPSFNPETYIYSDYWLKFDESMMGRDISNTDYDISHVKWGASWHLPTYQQCKELLDFVFEKHNGWHAVNSLKGGLLELENGTLFFMPFAGHTFDGEYRNSETSPIGLYLTANHCPESYIFSVWVMDITYNHLLQRAIYDGFSVRAVAD